MIPSLERLMSGVLRDYPNAVRQLLACIKAGCLDREDELKSRINSIIGDGARNAVSKVAEGNAWLLRAFLWLRQEEKEGPEARRMAYLSLDNAMTLGSSQAYIEAALLKAGLEKNSNWAEFSFAECQKIYSDEKAMELLKKAGSYYNNSNAWLLLYYIYRKKDQGSGGNSQEYRAKSVQSLARAVAAGNSSAMVEAAILRDTEEGRAYIKGVEVDRPISETSTELLERAIEFREVNAMLIQAVRLNRAGVRYWDIHGTHDPAPDLVERALNLGQPGDYATAARYFRKASFGSEVLVLLLEQIRAIPAASRVAVHYECLLGLRRFSELGALIAQYPVKVAALYEAEKSSLNNAEEGSYFAQFFDPTREQVVSFWLQQALDATATGLTEEQWSHFVTSENASHAWNWVEKQLSLLENSYSREENPAQKIRLQSIIEGIVKKLSATGSVPLLSHLFIGRMHLILGNREEAILLFEQLPLKIYKCFSAQGLFVMGEAFFLAKNLHLAAACLVVSSQKDESFKELCYQALNALQDEGISPFNAKRFIALRKAYLKKHPELDGDAKLLTPAPAPPTLFFPKTADSKESKGLDEDDYPSHHVAIDHPATYTSERTSSRPDYVHPACLLKFY